MNLLSNSPGSDLPVVSVVIALFLLVTVYYGLLYTTLRMPIKKLVVSYSIIILLLITILLISRYYFSFFKTFESFIDDYKHNNTTGTVNNINNINTNNLSHLNYTNNPFASIYDVDNMCQTSTQNKMDRNNIGWKCRVRNDFGHNALEVKSNDNTKSSIKYKLKYDGIHDVKQE